MDNHTLDEIIKDAYDREFAKYDGQPKHRFSFRHRRNMKKVFKLYEKNSEQQSVSASRPARRLSAVLVIAAAVVMLAAISSAAVSIYTNISWEQDDYSYHFLASDYKNAPKQIDYIYEFAALPDDYELIQEFQIDQMYNAVWENKETRDCVMLAQSVKWYFQTITGSKGRKPEIVYINDKPGLYTDWTAPGDEGSSFIVWDNGDYILEIRANMNKEEVLALAESAKISDRHVTNE